MSDVTIPTEPAGISMNSPPNFKSTSPARHLIAEMRNGDKWSVVENGRDKKSYYLRRIFERSRDEAYYCPHDNTELSNDIFAISFSNAPDLKLSFVEGLMAYTVFNRRVRAYKKLSKQFYLEHRNQQIKDFLERNGV